MPETGLARMEHEGEILTPAQAEKIGLDMEEEGRSMMDEALSLQIEMDNIGLQSGLGWSVNTHPDLRKYRNVIANLKEEGKRLIQEGQQMRAGV